VVAISAHFQNLVDSAYIDAFIQELFKNARFLSIVRRVLDIGQEGQDFLEAKENTQIH